MFKKLLKNAENNSINLDDLEKLYYLKDPLELQNLYKTAEKIHKRNSNKINYESNIYYPLIYLIEDNCPTCGYRTPVSRQKYTEEYIAKNIEYKLSDLPQYDIKGINCYNKDITGIRELLIILNILNKYNLEINVRISNPTHLKELTKYDNINSIIYTPQLNNNFNRMNKIKDNEEIQLLKYIHENMDLNIIYNFIINYNESHEDIIKLIDKVNDYKIQSIEIKGFDPFIDSPEEYNPQYSKENILKIISLLRIFLPKTELKIQYASNGNNYLKEYTSYGINTITGIYTPNMNGKLNNTQEIFKEWYLEKL